MAAGDTKDSAWLAGSKRQGKPIADASPTDTAAAMTLPAAHRRGQHHGFDQELRQPLAFQRADGQAPAVFAPAPGHADPHDLHEADVAHPQAHRDHLAQARGHDLDGAGQGLRQLLAVQQLEVVVVDGGQLAALAQLPRQAGLQPRAVAAVLRRHQPRVDAPRAGDTALQRVQRRGHGVTLVLGHDGRVGAPLAAAAPEQCAGTGTVAASLAGRLSKLLQPTRAHNGATLARTGQARPVGSVLSRPGGLRAA